MDDFEEASAEEVIQLGKSGSIQNDEPTLTDLRQPPDIDRETIDKAESEQDTFPCLNLSESCQDQSDEKTGNSLQQPDPIPNIPPQLDPEESTSKSAPNDLPLLPVSEGKTVPNNDLPHMESVSLSDGEDAKDDIDEKSKVIINDVITNDVSANDVSVNGDKYNSAFLLERIRELKDERDQLKIDAFERNKFVAGLESECAGLKNRLTLAEAEHKTAIAEHEKKFLQLSEEMGNKNSELKKYFMAANKEKESMVVKYAMGEKEIIIQRKGREEAEKKLQAVTKERDDALSKVKALTAERNRLQQIGDARYQDITVLKKDVERWKEESKIQETKASVAAGRLKTETDAHRETRSSLEATIKQLSETRQEIEKTRNECQDFMKKFREEEDARIKKLQSKDKEERVKLMIDEAAATELEALRVKYKSMVDENNSLSVKVQKFEKDRHDYDANLSKLKETVASQKQEVVDLMAQVAEMESLRMQLHRVEERSEERSAEVERLRSEAVELLSDMAACRRKEAELLEFTQKLTDKNVTLQSDLACLDGKASTLESDHRRLSAKLSECEKRLAATEIELEEEKKKRKVETEILAKKLAELSQQVEISNQKMIDAENEVLVLKRKHASSLRELTRELQTCKKQMESGESSARASNHRTSPLSHSSRASSNSSLNRGLANGEDNNNDNGRSSASNHLSLPFNGDSIKESSHEFSAQVPDSHILVEKIVKLQRTLARKEEKLEFMDDHISTMVEEMKKKNRLLQHYILQEESGALASASMDENKARTAAHGGIMASLYSSKQSDSGITLDLSLEINQKLQAVLEDTLLKNITLKENINTLGNEIASLANRKK